MRKSILVVYDNDDDFKRIEYVLNFIFNLPICKYEVTIEYTKIVSGTKLNYDVIINYSDINIVGAININKNEVVNRIGSFDDVLGVNCQSYFKADKELFGVTKLVLKERIEFVEGNTISLDIIDTIFFHLSRIEEYYCPNKFKDLHGRMSADSQFMVKHKTERIPVVDNISVAFLEVLNFHKEISTKKIMSHDVDVLLKYPSFYKFLRGVARILFKNKKNKGSLISYVKYYLKSLNGSIDPFNTFAWLFNSNWFDDKIVFFMTGGVTRFDNLYSIDDDSLKEVFKKAIDSGYKIGLHPSYNAFNNKDQFLKELTKLENVIDRKVSASRQHILHYDIQRTPQIMEEVKVKKDYTLGFQDRIGFRAGTGFDFYLWNHNENRKFDILETPLIIMDGCLLIETNYDVERAKKIHEKFYRENDKNTQITYNFHNSIFDPILLNEVKLKEFYLEL